MAEVVQVYAVPGRLYSLPGRKGEFVGYERLPPGTKSGDVVVPNGSAYVLRRDGEGVPNTVDVRRALSDGDITRTAPALPVLETDAGGDAGGEV
jgi:hypothetical protein